MEKFHSGSWILHLFSQIWEFKRPSIELYLLDCLPFMCSSSPQCTKSLRQCWSLEHCNFWVHIASALGKGLRYDCCQKNLCNKVARTSVSEKTHAAFTHPAAGGSLQHISKSVPGGLLLNVLFLSVPSFMWCCVQRLFIFQLDPVGKV